ncbi:MAG: DUF1292 domain-containing protein [Bacillota bacterium]|nr:DUF1292 domain-containing protein [Bacillota bacterium]
MDEEEAAIIELVDENGKMDEFEHIMTIEHEGAEYVLLSPLKEMEEIKKDEVFIMKLTQKDGDDWLEPLDDEKLMDEVYEIYCDILNNEEEAER